MNQSCANCKHPVQVIHNSKVYNCDKYRRDDGTFIMSSLAITVKMDMKSIPNVCREDGHFEAKND